MWGWLYKCFCCLDFDLFFIKSDFGVGFLILGVRSILKRAREKIKGSAKS